MNKQYPPTNPNDKVKVLRHEKINIDEVLDYRFMMETMILNLLSYEDTKDLIEQENYKKIVLGVNEREYILYHGFPSDIPLAVLQTPENTFILFEDNFEKTELTQENIMDIKTIVRWYNYLTYHKQEYNDDFWC